MSEQNSNADFSNFVNLAIDISMVIGPVIGYIYQYWLIRSKQALGTFSIDVCGILLFANIMRLNFYIFQHYKAALFFQSVLMVVVQLFLLQLCTSVARIKRQQMQQQNLQKSVFKTFWRWPYFYQFLLFIIVFSGLLTGISFLMKEVGASGVYGFAIGLIALMVESVLILPQIISNYQKGMVKGVSHLLLSFNLFGDIFKLIYFLLNDQPVQFIICGVTQVILDTFVIGQIFYYRWKNVPIKDEADIQFQNQIEVPACSNPNMLKASDKDNFSPNKAVKSQAPAIEPNNQLENQKKCRNRTSSASTAKQSEI